MNTGMIKEYKNKIELVKIQLKYKNNSNWKTKSKDKKYHEKWWKLKSSII